jgi:RHS repeat-associated protein
VVTEYAYDTASSLTGLTYRHGADVLGTLTYAYDAAGQRTGVGGTWARTALPPALAAATYDAANQHQTVGSATLTYDLNGNLTGDGTTSYTWGGRDRLASVSGPGTTAAFQYDALGRRTQKTVNSTTTDLLYDGLNPIEETGTTGITTILTGLGIDEYLTRTDAAGPRTLVTDALGSIVALTDAAGAVQTLYTYEPFGATAVTGLPDANEFQYTGRENDGTGLYYYRARYYHPGLARFLSEDPGGFRGGDFNLYAYVWNAPVRYRDPIGWWGVGGVVGGNAQVGLPGLAGAAASLLYGWGLFGGGCHGTRDEAFISGGGFVTPMTSAEQMAIGAYAGYGGGIFLTNATDVSQIGGASDTWSVDTGMGPLRMSISLSFSGNGIVTGTITGGWGAGAGAARLPTTTGHARVPQCPPTQRSKSSG